MKILKLSVVAMFFSAVFGTSVFAFTDLDENNFAYNSISTLYVDGVVKGYDDGTFRPNAKINRAEFLKIVFEEAKVQGRVDGEIEGANCFKDVTDQWFAKYVCKAKKQGFVDGYSDGNFRPEQNINFVEAAKIIDTVLKIGVDDKYIDAWYEKYVVALEQFNAIPVTILNFNQELTRADMSEIIVEARTVNVYDPNISYASLKITSQWDDAKLLISNAGGNGDFYSHDGKVYGIEYGKSYLAEGADPTTFKHLAYSFYVDKKSLYYVEGSSFYNGVKPVGNVNVDKMELLYPDDVVNDNGVGEIYVRDDKNVYYGRYGIEVINDIDLESALVFPCNSRMCLKDNDKMYYVKYDGVDTYPIDGDTFEVMYVLDSTDWWKNYFGYYSYDKDNVYLFDFADGGSNVFSVLADADPKTFVYYVASNADEALAFFDFGIDAYLVDAGHVWFYRAGIGTQKVLLELVPGVDMATFSTEVAGENLVVSDATHYYELDVETGKVNVIDK